MVHNPWTKPGFKNWLQLQWEASERRCKTSLWCVCFLKTTNISYYSGPERSTQCSFRKHFQMNKRRANSVNIFINLTTHDLQKLKRIKTQRKCFHGALKYDEPAWDLLFNTQLWPLKLKALNHTSQRNHHFFFFFFLALILIVSVREEDML